MRRPFLHLAGASLLLCLLVGLLVGRPARPRAERADFDLSMGTSGASEPPLRSRSGRLQRALETIVSGLESGEREAADRARRTAAGAYQAGGDSRLAESHLRVAATGAGEVAARARLELAHLARRGGDLGAARVGYVRALLDVELPRRAREAAARAWAGLERDAGDAALGDALRVVLALDARRARDRVRAWSVLVRAREARAPRLASWLSYACVYREARGGIDDELRARLVAFACRAR